jgi:hypothetical protein
VRAHDLEDGGRFRLTEYRGLADRIIDHRIDLKARSYQSQCGQLGNLTAA